MTTQMSNWWTGTGVLSPRKTKCLNKDLHGMISRYYEVKIADLNDWKSLEHIKNSVRFFWFGLHDLQRSLCHLQAQTTRKWAVFLNNTYCKPNIHSWSVYQTQTHLCTQIQHLFAHTYTSPASSLTPLPFPWGFMLLRPMPLTSRLQALTRAGVALTSAQRCLLW